MDRWEYEEYEGYVAYVVCEASAKKCLEVSKCQTLCRIGTEKISVRRLTCSLKLFSMAFNGSRELTDSLRCDNGPPGLLNSLLLELFEPLPEKSYELLPGPLPAVGPPAPLCMLLLNELLLLIIDPLAMPVLMRNTV